MKSFFLSLCSFLFALCAAAQVSPVPQKAEWGGVAIAGDVYFNIQGSKTADQDAVRALETLLEGRTAKVKGARQVKVAIGERGDASVSAWKKKIPTTAEGYYLAVDRNQIVVAGADEAGTFYGVQTLRQIMRETPDSLRKVEIADWPDVAERGVVEGFYGNPWSHADRLRQFEFYGENKMNTYIYGPKDDPYHRDYWRKPYPADQAQKISELAEAARRNKVKFVWAVHPGVDIKWIREDSLNIVKKLESVYDMGIRSFAVFFDDIGGEGARAEKQAGLLNYITDEFVRKHTDVEPLIMCPTEYNKSWSGKTYLPTLGRMMYPEVRVMWTGATVVDMINEADVDWIISALGRKPYIWLNWPVNDYCVDHLLMGATYGNDLTISDRLAGFVSNPMEYAEASKVSLYSIADYTWHLAAYDSQTSWKNAIRTLMPDHTAAFETFCEYCTDLGPNGHGMRRMEESARLAKAVKDGDTQTISYEVNRMLDAAQELLRIKGNPLIDEIRPWLRVMEITGTRASLAISAKQSAIAGNKMMARGSVGGIRMWEHSQQKIVSRDFPGSIKSPNPRVATLVLEPYVKQTMRDAEYYYRKQWGNSEGLFPEPVVDDSQYYIVCDGKRLTDTEANPNRVGDHPVFVAYNDTINPARQQWSIRIDSQTGRYKIANVQDGRYVNELGTFWQSTSNPYDASWHTFVINKGNAGKYSIQTAGSAGNGFLTVSGDRIKRVRDEQQVFELIKVE